MQCVLNVYRVVDSNHTQISKKTTLTSEHRCLGSMKSTARMFEASAGGQASRQSDSGLDGKKIEGRSSGFLGGRSRLEGELGGRLFRETTRAPCGTLVDNRINFRRITSCLMAFLLRLLRRQTNVCPGLSRLFQSVSTRAVRPLISSTRGNDASQSTNTPHEESSRV